MEQFEKTFPKDEWYARWSYDRLALLQPQIGLDGLWKRGNIFFAVCPELEEGTVAHDGSPIEKWFSGNKAMTCPIKLTNSAPTGSIRIPGRTAVDLAELRGEPLTVRDVSVQLSIRLSRGFPEFRFDTHPPIAFVTVPRALTREEEMELRAVCGIWLENLRLEIVIDPGKFVPGPFRLPHPVGVGDIDLIPSRRFSAITPKPIRDAMERDEDFWSQYHVEVLSGTSVEPTAWLGKSIPLVGSRCLVDPSIFPPRNLRTYLTLFRNITLVAPLETQHDQTLLSLAVTQRELVELARRKRVQVLFPQSLDRYRESFLAEVFELKSRPYLLSRRLAAATVADMRRRVPLMYPPLGMPERRILLESFLKAGTKADSAWVKSMVTYLGETWTSAERSIHARGAMGMITHGVGPILGSMVNRATGKDLRLEFVAAAQPICWAGAIGATMFPSETGTSSFQAITELCASAYSGIRNEAIPIAYGDVEPVLQGLFALESDAPILEVEEAFSFTDIERTNDVVFRLTRENLSPSELQRAVGDLNARVRQYNSRTARLSRMDVVSMIGALVPCVASEAAAPVKFIPMGVWLLKFLLQGADSGMDFPGQVIEWLRAVNAWTTRDVVLVSRLRKRVGKG